MSLTSVHLREALRRGVISPNEARRMMWREPTIESSRGWRRIAEQMFGSAAVIGFLSIFGRR